MKSKPLVGKGFWSDCTLASQALVAGSIPATRFVQTHQKHVTNLLSITCDLSEFRVLDFYKYLDFYEYREYHQVQDSVLRTHSLGKRRLSLRILGT